MGGRGGSSSRSGGGGRASLPTLTGSEKQISWANDIREQAYIQLDALDRTISRIKKDVSKRGGMSKNAIKKEAESLAGFSESSIKTVRSELNDTLSKITSAKTIIDQRNNLSPDSIRQLVTMEFNTGAISAARKRRK